MSDISVKDYMIHNLQKEYTKYSQLLGSFQEHLERCCDLCIITVDKRNSYYKSLNDVLRQINTIYNNTMVSICDVDEDSTKDLADMINSASSTNKSDTVYEDIRRLINMYSIINDKNTLIDLDSSLYHTPFMSILPTLLDDVASKLGFNSLDDGLCLLIGEQYRKIFPKRTVELLEMHNKIYVPLSYRIKDVPPELIKGTVFLKSVIYDYDTVLEDTACLYVNISAQQPNRYIIFSGYYKRDPLNIAIRTSQICNNVVYHKKKRLESFVTKNSNIKRKDERFFKMYMRNMSIGTVLIHSNEEFITKIEKDYSVYTDLIKLDFMSLMKEFIGNGRHTSISIKHMFDILRLLLLGSEKNVNIAGLLFGISREKKTGADFFISDVIYRNLSYISQAKLKKSGVNIKQELEKIKAMSTEDVDLKKQIVVCKNMPNAAKRAALEKVEEMKSSNNEYYKQMLYVKTLLNYPWPSETDDSVFNGLRGDQERSIKFLDNINSELNTRVFGHKECKNTIKELIGKLISKPNSAGSSLGLVGPPGVGKTLIAKAIGAALDIPFVQITLGGQNDGEILHGHGYTYSGAQPGMVIKKMIEAGNSRCIIYFDELDKASRKQDTNEIFSILIHMTDPNTNDKFQDRFFQDINFFLRNVLFIFSYNDSKKIDPILLDRIEEVAVKPFQLKDKKVIFSKFLMNEMSDMIGFERDSVVISDDDVEFIISQYTYEPGVRNLKRKLERIFLKMNIDKIYGTGVFKKVDNFGSDNAITLDRDTIINYLGKNYASIQKVHKNDTVGVVSGLYATDAGSGGVLPIQIYNNFTGDGSRFMLKLTGSQRRVMRESVLTAFTTAMHLVKETVRNKYVSAHPHGFHIHAPSGATPKDGPSAGGAFATAFMSRILNKKIRHDIAMTGEIELTGKITKIGGLQYKLTGAKKAGVTLALVSKENAEDLDTIKTEYPDLFKDGSFKVVLVEHLRDILKHALVGFKESDLIKA